MATKASMEVLVQQAELEVSEDQDEYLYDQVCYKSSHQKTTAQLRTYFHNEVMSIMQ